MDLSQQTDETDLVRLLRSGDPDAFRALVRRYHASMTRVAASFVPSASIAEEVVQETWLAVVRGIGTFEERSSLRTWMFAILVNQARSRGAREQRTNGSNVSLSRIDDDGAAAPADLFVGRAGRGRWRDSVDAWQNDPQLQLESADALATISGAIRELPPVRRQVLVLRDIEGWTARDVAALLGLSEINQRVLLHRARNAVRLRLEQGRQR